MNRFCNSVRRSLALALFLSIGMLLAACNPPRNTQNMQTNQDPKTVDRGAANLNPAPKQAYRITLTIDNPPGPFAQMKAKAQYDVTNESLCGHIDPIRGTADRITSNEPFELKKIADNQYEGVVYVDYMLDEAYYEREVCHWEFTEVRVRLRATGAKEETRFIPDISAKDVLAEKSVTTYFWRARYPRSGMDNYPDSGAKDPNRIKPELRNDLFTMTLKAERIEP